MELQPHLQIQKVLQGTQYPIDDVKPVGSGNEGFVFESGEYVFKLISIAGSNSTDFPGFIRKTILNNREVSCVRRVVDIIETPSEVVFVSPNENCTPYCGGDEEGTLRILADAYRYGYVHTNFKPANVMYAHPGTVLKIIDIGRDLVPFSFPLYKNMVERAFLTTYQTNNPNLKKMMSSLHTDRRNVDETGLKDYIRKLFEKTGVINELL